MFGNESADSGNYQVGIRVAHALGLPVVTGLKKVEVGDGRVRCERDAGGARDVYEAPLPAVLTVLEGLNLPRYPSVPGRLRAKSQAARRRRAGAAGAEAGEAAPRAAGGPGQDGGDPRRGAGGRAEGRRGHAVAGRRMRPSSSTSSPDDELSLQALAFARGLGTCAPSRSTARTSPPRGPPPSPPPRTEPTRSSPPASDRGNELLAHVAAQLDQPFAANVTAVDGDTVTRVRWGGSLLEEARLHGSPLHPLGRAARASRRASSADVETLTAPDDGSPRVLERVEESPGGVSLATRRSSSAAAAASAPPRASRSSRSSPGCSARRSAARASSRARGGGRTPTRSARPGRRSPPTCTSPAGSAARRSTSPAAKGAKKILAINSDPEAPILASADYAVIGDLHEIVPAISAELRKARGT